jgi:hypothetical protein
VNAELGEASADVLGTNNTFGRVLEINQSVV